MKIKINLLLASIALSTASVAFAGAEHDHSGHDHADAHGEKSSTAEAAHAQKGGPNGGRMIMAVEPHAEFIVTADRFVQIAFIDHDGAAVPVAEQTASLIGGSRSAPTKVEFAEKDGMLVSTTALPEIDNMQVILTLKPSASAKTVRERFKLNTSECGSCDFKEYACICAH